MSRSTPLHILTFCVGTEAGINFAVPGRLVFCMFVVAAYCWFRVWRILFHYPEETT